MVTKINDSLIISASAFKTASVESVLAKQIEKISFKESLYEGFSTHLFRASVILVGLISLFVK